RDGVLVAGGRIPQPLPRLLRLPFEQVELAEIARRLAVVAIHLERLLEPPARLAVTGQPERRDAGQPIDRVVADGIERAGGVLVRPHRVAELQAVPGAPVALLAG